MTNYTYPGVYIEEIPSGVRTITGVATSITAFVGYTRKGEPDKAVAITSFADFERLYGGLDRESPLSYAVNQFYMNRGTQALIVRVADGYKSASQKLTNADTTPVDVLEISASSPGQWGDKLYIRVIHNEVLNADGTVRFVAPRNPDSDFNLIVLQDTGEAGVNQPVVKGEHRNLSLNSKSTEYVESVVNHASKLIRVKRKVQGSDFTKTGFATSKPFSPPTSPPTDLVISGRYDGGTPFNVELPAAPTSLAELVSKLQIELDAKHLGLDASTSYADGDETGGNCLKLASRNVGEISSVSIDGGQSGGLMAVIGLGLANGGREFTGAAQQFRPKKVNQSPMTELGNDGKRPTATQIMGNESSKSGMQALLNVDLFNLLVIPETFDMDDASAKSVVQKGVELCVKRRAFYIVDPPFAKDFSNIVTWANDASMSRNAAVYFPAVYIADQLDKLRPKAMAASGTLAGVFARTDAQRGVWKAPAGTDAVLNGVDSITVSLNDIENGTLNQKGVNALRAFSAYGKVAWGARTMKGSDAQADEYKYIPIRRLALYIEESLYRGTQWVVFEPNDDPLWAQIRLNIGAFMHGLFRQGAFQGTSPRDAYFVKCDRETTTETDRNLGIVNIFVGFAPLKPAEFVVIKIQQMAGQIET